MEFSKQAQEAIQHALDFCKSIGADLIGTEHMICGILATDSYASTCLKQQGVDKSRLENSIRQATRPAAIYGEPNFSGRMIRVINQAAYDSQRLALREMSCEIILFALLSEQDSIGCELLRQHGIDTRTLQKQLADHISQKTTPIINKSSNALPQQLKDLGINMTQRAQEGKIDAIIGRSKEIERIIQILCRKTKNNPVLIGEPGVGKSAVVEGLALAIAKGDVPELLKDKIVFALDIASIVAGTKYRGDLEQKLKTAIDTIIQRGDIIVFIDELHTLATSGSDKGEVNPADMLKPYLARGELQTIGATTTDEYRKFIEEDKALERRFQPIFVNPPSIEETIEILQGIKANYEKFHGITITDEAIVAAATLSDRYIMDRFLPDKAIDLIDEASSKARVKQNIIPSDIKELEEDLNRKNEQKKRLLAKEDYPALTELKKQIEEQEKTIAARKSEWLASHSAKTHAIGEEEIAKIVADWTKIPVSKISETEKDRLVRLEEILHARVIGQQEAVQKVSRAIRRARAGLKDQNRPIGTFLFLGPTGVGKTELTKAIAEAVFDDEGLIVRIDMSEYMESHSVSKLIGAPPGYVGFGEAGQLTEAVRRKPYSVVLFDELEKAHDDVFNLLLQILDEGRLTDSKGRVVSFKNTIIIMTSNVGVDQLKYAKRIGFGDEEQAIDTQAVLGDALKRRFKPEFLNRIDATVFFHALTKQDLQQIAQIKLQALAKKLQEKSITLKFAPTAVDYIIDNSYSPEFGARPLRRFIEQRIEDELAEAILSNTISNGDNVLVDIKDNKFIFLKS